MVCFYYKDILNKLKMERKRKILKAHKVISISKKTKSRISIIAENIKGKDLFPEKVNAAKRTLSKLKSLPI